MIRMSDKQFKKDFKKYIKDINSYLICDCGTRNKFIRDLKSDIDEYIENNSVTDFDSVYKHFGAPRDIAKGFLETADTKKIKRKMDITKVVLIGIIIALVMWGIGITSAIIDAHESNTGYKETVLGNPEYGRFELFDIGDLL